MIPADSRVARLVKGDYLITYPGDRLATLRVRADGIVRTALLNEPVDHQTENEAKNFVQKAIADNRVTQMT